MSEDGTLLARYHELFEQVFQTPRAFVGFLLAILVLPFVFTVGLATEILILGIFALSYNLMFGFGGLLSFGHALFFGGGAYVAALIVVEIGLPMIPVLLVTLAVGLFVAFLIGVISLRLSGIAFAMVTLAFAQLGYEIVRGWRDLTGGDDGFGGIFRPSPFVESGLLDLSEPLLFYAFTAVVAIVCIVFTYVMAGSLYGRALKAIRLNEERTEALGVNVFWLKVSVFTIAGGMGAVAGVLWAVYIRFVSPGVLFWETTGDAILYSLIGGMHSVLGPVLGAGFLRGAERLLFRTEPGIWNITVGAVFVLIVLFERGGIIALAKRVTDRAEDILGQLRSK